MNIPRYNFENLNINKINDDIRDKGIAIIDNFLNSDQTKKISNEHKFIYDNNIKIGKYHKDNFTKSFLINYRIRDLKFNKELEFSNQLIKDKIIKKMISVCLGKSYGINNFISHYVDNGETDGEIFPLHMDFFKSNKFRCIKVYLYLTDTNVNNGAFRYLPVSHNLIRNLINITDANLIKNEKLKNKFKNLGISEKGLTLQDVIEIIKFDKNSIKNYDKIVDYLVKKDISEIANDNKLLIEGKAGTLIIFDSHGLHGGVSVKDRPRDILRIHYFDKEYKEKYLLDQCNLFIKIKSKVVSKFR